MAPAARKRKSDEVEDMSRPATPTASPMHKKLKVTEAQKQALIDNLQLEIDERERRLRAHYALQCADLRSRIERRINRIPVAMRKMTMGEVMAKHEQAIKAQPAVNKQPILPVASSRPLPQLPQETAKHPQPKRLQTDSPALRGRKRKTSEIHIASDGDSENQLELDNLPVAKKTRGKGAAAGAAAPATTRAASRTQKAPSVLSPRSHNSRTLARSPIKEWKGPANPSPMRSAIARPISPIKPASPLKSAAFAISAAAQGMARGAAATASKLGRTASKEKTATTPTMSAKGRMLPPPRPVTGGTGLASPTRQSSAYTTTSERSTTSSGTTIVNKPRRGRPAKAPEEKMIDPATKKTTAGSSNKAALKGSAAGTNKKVVVAEPAAGRRVLRKRN